MTTKVNKTKTKMETRSNKKDNANIEGTDSAWRATPDKGPVGGEQDSVILAELRKLRQEHTEAANDNKNTGETRN